MAIDFDTSRAPRLASEQVALIRAVMAAGEHDETTWCEAKSSLELTEKAAWFQIARNVLGFANRSPDSAALMVEGYGYVVVGADHDGCHGVDTVDPAQLEQGIAQYLGTGDGTPRWSLRYVDVDGKSVLVVSIEPPRWGDHIMTLRKTYQQAQAGAIFVRMQAKTDHARVGEVAMLEDRYRRGGEAPGMALGVTAIVQDASGLFCLADYEDEGVVDNWVTLKRDKLMQAIPEVEKTDTPISSIKAGLNTIVQRSNYVERVDKFLAECRPLLLPHAINSVIGEEVNKLRPRVVNQGEQALDGVRLVIDVDAAQASAYVQRPYAVSLPDEPRWEETPSIIGRFGTTWSSAPGISTQASKPVANGAASIREEDGVISIAWLFDDLHAGQSDFGQLVTVLPRIGTGELHLRWRATAKNRTGSTSGTMTVPVVNAPPMTLMI